MRVDKVRLSWFILLNSYVLKKEKEKSGYIHPKRKEKWNINPYACEQGCLDSSYQTHTFSKTEQKKVVIYFQKEKKRKVKYNPYDGKHHAKTHHWWETYTIR